MSTPFFLQEAEPPFLYPTAGIGIRLAFFYGIMWAVYFYVFAYLIPWRMRRSSDR